MNNKSVMAYMEIASLRQQLAEAMEKNNFDAKRLRVLTNLLGMSVPESDETLLACAGTVLGTMRRVIEDMFKTTNDLTAQLEEAMEKMIEREDVVAEQNVIIAELTAQLEAISEALKGEV